jgi:hypothetical protein
MLVPLLTILMAASAVFLVYRGQTDELPEGLEMLTVGDRVYAVRTGQPGADDRAAFLDEMYQRNVILLAYILDNFPEDPRTARLINATPQIREVEAASTEAGYSENKGEAIALCLKDDDYRDKMEELYFVMIHELAHIASENYGHDAEFWECQDWVQECAIRAGVYEYKDYSQSPSTICAFRLDQNPCTSCADI